MQCAFTARTAKRGRPSTVVQALKAEQEQSEASSSTAVDLDWLLNPCTTTERAAGAEETAFYSPQSTLPAPLPFDGGSNVPSSTSRPRRAKTTDEIAPRDTILDLVRLWFKHWHSFVPCLDQQDFLASCEARQDAHDPNFYSLLLALCSAACACSHRLPMPPALALEYATWEDAARRFNASMPPAR